MSFFNPFFFLLLDSALGSDLSGAEAVCSLLAPLPAAVVEVDSLEEAPPAAGVASVALPVAVPVAAGALSVPVAGAGCSGAAAGCSGAGAAESSVATGVASMGFGKLPVSDEPGATSLVPEVFRFTGAAVVVSPLESPDPAGTVCTAIEFPVPPPPPVESTPGTAPGLSTSVAEVASTGGVKLGAPARAAIEVSGLLLITPSVR